MSGFAHLEDPATTIDEDYPRAYKFFFFTMVVFLAFFIGYLAYLFFFIIKDFKHLLWRYKFAFVFSIYFLLAFFLC